MLAEQRRKMVWMLEAVGALFILFGVLKLMDVI